jgi:hypothetical protein
MFARPWKELNIIGLHFTILLAAIFSFYVHFTTSFCSTIALRYTKRRAICLDLNSLDIVYREINEAKEGARFSYHYSLGTRLITALSIRQSRKPQSPASYD